MTKLYGSVFPVLLARWIGWRGPLIDRLRAAEMPLAQSERDYLASVLAGTEPRWRTPKKVIIKNNPIPTTLITFIFA